MYAVRTVSVSQKSRAKQKPIVLIILRWSLKLKSNTKTIENKNKALTEWICPKTMEHKKKWNKKKKRCKHPKQEQKSNKFYEHTTHRTEFIAEYAFNMGFFMWSDSNLRLRCRIWWFNVFVLTLFFSSAFFSRSLVLLPCIFRMVFPLWSIRCSNIYQKYCTIALHLICATQIVVVLYGSINGNFGLYHSVHSAVWQVDR